MEEHGETLSERLERWGYPERVNKKVRPLLEVANFEQLAQFEWELCEFTREVLRQLETQGVSAKEVDQMFMVLDLYVTETDLRDKLSEEAQDLLAEGMLFHHFGDKHGPNIEHMREIIREKLGPS